MGMGQALKAVFVCCVLLLIIGLFGYALGRGSESARAVTYYSGAAVEAVGGWFKEKAVDAGRPEGRDQAEAEKKGELDGKFWEP